MLIISRDGAGQAKNLSAMLFGARGGGSCCSSLAAGGGCVLVGVGKSCDLMVEKKDEKKPLNPINRGNITYSSRFSMA